MALIKKNSIYLDHNISIILIVRTSNYLKNLLKILRTSEFINAMF